MSNMKKTDGHQVLLATPDSAYAIAVKPFIEADGCVVERCHDPKGILRLAGRQDFDVLLLDLDLVGEGDLELISFIERQSPKTQIILLYGDAQIDQAIEGLRRGAFFYLPKSCLPSDVALIVGKALKASQTLFRVQALEQSVFEEMVGGSPAMKRVVELITKVAPTDTTVLLLGESGTGKEVMANTIHRLSPRRDNAFIAINCAALPEQLLDSELFGHAKGAFTGAHADKVGLFEEADNGTIFLDEIGDTSQAMQAKLLRVLQNGEFRRVGDSTNRRVDVRILAATNINLVQAVSEKEFREDLYFRINVIQIVIPPLRERLDALPALTKQFVRRCNERFGKNVSQIDDHARTLLRGYAYPGNIRELESIVAHAVILCDGDTISASDLPDQVRFGAPPRLALPDPSSDRLPTIQEMEKRLIETALERLDGNQTEVAKQLGISRSTLWRKIKEYEVARPGQEDEEEVLNA